MTKLARMKEKLYLLFEQYKKPSTERGSQSNESTPQHPAGEKGIATNMHSIQGFIAYEGRNVIENGKSFLDTYLEEGKLEMKYIDEIDVLQYWKDHKHRYGELAEMACDVLSISVTTVASESAFSIGAHVLSKYRSRLLPSHVQALICTRNWLLGYVPPEDAVADEDEYVDPPVEKNKTSVSEVRSNVLKINDD